MPALMQLLRGEAGAHAAARILSGPGVPAVSIDGRGRAGQKLQVLALANESEAILIDVQGTQSLPALIGRDNPIAAYEAKAVARALLRTYDGAPERWACIRLTEVLLQGGRDAPLTLDAIAARHGVAAPPPVEQGLEAMAAHTQALATLLQKQIPLLKQEGLGWVSRLEAAATSALAAMEHHGMPFDDARWREVHRAIDEERVALRQRLGTTLSGGTDLFGKSTLNLDNDAELKAALNARGYPVPDARRATLAELPAPLGPDLARYRELQKLATAYGEGFLEHVGPDGRLHPTFEQIGASTGRLSCHSPNLQSMVKDAPHRECFRAREGRILVIGDYATCELRILAEMSGDPVFAEAFARGDDLHAIVASRVFKKPVSKHENPELRDRAKAVNFGLVYGMGAQGLARAIDSDLPTAEDLLRRYFSSFPKIKGFLEHTAREALERGHAKTLTGRRLYLDPGPDRSSRSQAERIAKNMPIQGTSADITKIALARLHRALAPYKNAWLVNTVHDEIVLEGSVEHADELALLLEREMRGAGEEVLKRIPLKVDVAKSAYWSK